MNRKMPEFDSVLEEAADELAFSNGTEADAWLYHYCRICINDQDPDHPCQLITVAMLGKTPVQWKKDQPGSLGSQYTCDLYRKIP